MLLTGAYPLDNEVGEGCNRRQLDDLYSDGSLSLHMLNRVQMAKAPGLHSTCAIFQLEDLSCAR